MRLTIDAPTRWLNANDREHRIGDNVNVQAWKQAALDVAYNACGPRGESPFPPWPVTVTATIHKSRRGRWDAHNLYPTLKACIDGLVAAGLIPDDSNEYVVAVTIRAGEIRKPAALVLDIEAA